MLPPFETAATVQRGQAILATLGTFWTELHKDKKLWRTYAKGCGEGLAQCLLDYYHYLNSLGRKTCPVYKQQTWKKISIRLSHLDASVASAIRYGDGALYGTLSPDIKLYCYGDHVSATIKKIDIEENWKRAGVLTNTPVAPTVMLTHGTDFWFETEPQAIVFRSNPFTLSGMPISDIRNEAGDVVDKEITLWAWDNQLDTREITNRFGVLLNIIADSSEGLKNVVNAALDCLTSGTSNQYVREFICSVLGIRTVQYDVEVVTDVATAGDSLVVATSRAAYRFPATSTPIVEVGDIVRRGDFLTDDVVFLKSESELRTLPGMVVVKAFGDLLQYPISFPNETKPLVVSTVNGKTKVSAELYGDTDGIRRYWNACHAAGIAAGTTIANALDHRSNPTTEPTVADLPKEINPYELLLREMSGNLLVIKIKATAFANSDVQSQVMSALERLLPARATCLLLVEANVNFDYYEVSAATETLSLHEGIAMPVDTMTANPGLGQPGYFDSGMKLKVVNSPCSS